MPLAKQVIGFPFAQGIDTKTDPKSVLAGRLVALENALFTRPGRLSKRNGFRSLGRLITGTSDRLEDGQALLTFKSELLSAASSTLYSYEAQSETWVEKGAIDSPRVTTRPVSRSSVELKSQDSATHPDGLQAFAWEGSSGYVYYSVVDSVTGQVIVADATLATAARKPRVLVFGNRFVFIWLSVTNRELVVGTLPIATPTATITGTTITENSANANSVSTTESNYEACVMDTSSGPQMYVAFNNRNTVQTVSLWRFTASSVTTPVAKVTSENTGTPDLGTSVGPIGLWSGKAGVGYPTIAWVDADDNLDYQTFASQLVDASNAAVSISNDQIQALSDPTLVTSITGSPVTASGVDFAFDVFYTFSDASSTKEYYTVSRRVDEASIGTATTTRSVFLCSKAFTIDNQTYALTAYDSIYQPTYFLIDSTGSVVAKAHPGTAEGAFDRDDAYDHLMLPSVSLVGDSGIRIATRERRVLDSSSGQLFTLAGVSSLTIDLDHEAAWSRAELGSNLHTGGGILRAYDGTRPVEHGFNLFPEGVSLSTSAAGSTYTYSYVVVYEWTDGQGGVHRSAESIPATITSANPIGSGGGTSTTTVTVPYLALTEKSDIICSVYRTVNNGTTYYRVTDQDDVVNNPSSISTTHNDSITDAALVGRPLLYTTGGVLENIAAPPTHAMTVHRNRLWLVDSGDPLTLWYSKIVKAGAPVEFTDSFTLRIDGRGGDVTALGSLDDKLIIFKSSSIYAVTGQGPDDLGQQNDFSDASRIASDVGCANPKSLVLTPDGLMFVSTKGIYLLDRGLNVTYIGAPVEQWNSETITSVVVMPDTNTVRFTLDGTRRVLVYDYLMRQWGTFTNVNAVDSAIWNGAHVYIMGSGTVRTETPGQFTDDGSYIPMKVKTSHLQFAGLQGFQRVRRVLIIGEKVGAHRLRVSIANNFSPSPSQVEMVEVSSPSVYGGDASWGSGTVYGGESGLHQYRIFPTRQKTQAMQLTIEDVGPTGDADIGEGMSLSGITFEVGVKRGPYRVAASKTLATPSRSE